MGRRMFSFVAALAIAAAPLTAAAGDFEDEVLAELNFARTHPQAYAREALRAPAAYGGEGFFMDPRDQEPAALAEAIDFLMVQPPLSPLRPHAALAAAAESHVRDQGPIGALGHAGSNGSSPGARMQAHGVWAGLSAENISYGQPSARQVVLQLIVDAGVPGRGHRKTIFGPAYQVAGVACGPHQAWREMCVIDFAGALVAR